MFVLVNLKAYDCNTAEIARAAAAAGADAGARVAVSPQTARIEAVSETGVETWAQHVSPTNQGSHTGSALAEAAADAGAVGTLLNHSEKRLRLADIDAGIDAARRAGLAVVTCANDPDQCAAVAALGPDAVAVEPPELIGGDESVSTADPEIVTDAVAAVGEIDEGIDVFCGAGISSGDDVESAEELGASGVLLASGVAKADGPERVLRDLVSPVA